MSVDQVISMGVDVINNPDVKIMFRLLGTYCYLYGLEGLTNNMLVDKDILPLYQLLGEADGTAIFEQESSLRDQIVIVLMYTILKAKKKHDYYIYQLNDVDRLSLMVSDGSSFYSIDELQVPIGIEKWSKIYPIRISKDMVSLIPEYDTNNVASWLPKEALKPGVDVLAVLKDYGIKGYGERKDAIKYVINYKMERVFSKVLK
jgi:hypothetical protein